LGWNIRYTHKQDVMAETNDRTTPSWTVHDLQANWFAPWNARLTVGVDNVGNKMPPIDMGMSVGFNNDLYNPYGRIPYFRYTQSF